MITRLNIPKMNQNPYSKFYSITIFSLPYKSNNSIKKIESIMMKDQDNEVQTHFILSA